MMDPNALIVQYMLDRQAEISELRARIAELEAEREHLLVQHAEAPVTMPQPG